MQEAFRRYTACQYWLPRLTPCQFNISNRDISKSWLPSQTQHAFSIVHKRGGDEGLLAFSYLIGPDSARSASCGISLHHTSELGGWPTAFVVSMGLSNTRVGESNRPRSDYRFRTPSFPGICPYLITGRVTYRGSHSWDAVYLSTVYMDKSSLLQQIMSLVRFFAKGLLTGLNRCCRVQLPASKDVRWNRQVVFTSSLSVCNNRGLMCGANNKIT